MCVCVCVCVRSETTTKLFDVMRERNVFVRHVPQGFTDRVDRVREWTVLESAQGERVNRVREWTG